MFRDKLKGLIKKDGEEGNNNKKNIENLVFFIILLIITIIIINIIWKGDTTSSKQENSTNSKQLASSDQNVVTQNTSENDNELEEKLEEILSKIQGVGDVNVFINYSESNEIIAMYNENSKISTTEETDTSGGTRKIEETDIQKDIIFNEEDGNKTPITQKVVNPKIEGAIVTAKGANDANTKTNIIQAVEAVTGLASHKIQVFEMN